VTARALLRATSIACALLVGAVGWARLAPAHAEPAKAEPAKAEPVELAPEVVAGWVERLEEAQAKLAKTRTKLAADEAALSRARHRRYPRGDALDELEVAVRQGRRDLADAEAALPALLEEARRAGVPAGARMRFEDAL